MSSTRHTTFTSPLIGSGCCSLYVAIYNSDVRKTFPPLVLVAQGEAEGVLFIVYAIFTLVVPGAYPTLFMPVTVDKLAAFVVGFSVVEYETDGEEALSGTHKVAYA